VWVLFLCGSDLIYRVYANVVLSLCSSQWERVIEFTQAKRSLGLMSGMAWRGLVGHGVREIARHV
jgi:hypothetical protein